MKSIAQDIPKRPAPSVSPGPGAPEKMPAIPIQMHALLMFKAGIARGHYEVRVTVKIPGGKESPIATLPALFEGEDGGVNLILNLNFSAQEQGVYWFGIFLQEQLVTRIPLRIIYQRIGLGAPPPSQ